MRNQYTAIFKATMILMLLISNAFAQAVAYDYSANVFKFQQKLAKKGDMSAQYKLGFMYETGEGTRKDLEEALKWYEKSAAQGSAAAKRRLVYIDVLKHGYQPERHKGWLKQLKKDAASQDGDAMLLLGVMYKNGTAVNKDLQKAEALLNQAVLNGVPGADARLESVSSLIAVEKARALERKQKQLAIERAERKRREQARQQAREQARRAAELERRKIQQQRILAQQEAARKRQAQAREKARQQSVSKKAAPAGKSSGLSWSEAVERHEGK